MAASVASDRCATGLTALARIAAGRGMPAAATRLAEAGPAMEAARAAWQDATRSWDEVRTGYEAWDKPGGAAMAATATTEAHALTARLSRLVRSAPSWDPALDRDTGPAARSARWPQPCTTPPRPSPGSPPPTSRASAPPTTRDGCTSCGGSASPGTPRPPMT